MRRLITLGCSLTHQAGWAQYLSECMKLPLFNLAQSAGSNQLQQRRIQEFIFSKNIIDADIVLWQLTSTVRYYKREQVNSENQKIIESDDNQKSCPTMLFSNKNIFDNTIRVDHLCNSADQMYDEIDEEQQLEDLIFYLISLKKFTPNLFVFLGWNDAIPLAYHQIFKTVLKKHQINFIDVPLVDWCIENNLDLDRLLHPTVGSSSKYASDILIPLIEKQLNIKINRVRLWAK
jgi:hypothetical protein